MRQLRWMKYLEQYNFVLKYHPGKANVIADVLSQKTQCSIACLTVDEWEMPQVLNEYGLGCVEMKIMLLCSRLLLNRH